MTTGRRYWLILSYRANIDGSACAQHIDDRLPYLARRGITPVLLTGPVGARFQRWPHFRCWSIAPSGIRFELRHALRKRLRRRWQFKLVETLLLLPVFPFYLLEKLIINLESEWSWFFAATVRGYALCRRYRPEVIYSTGGTAAAHGAAGILRRLTGLPWLAETQDPLVHDQGWRRGRRVLALYRWFEKWLCANADAFVFLARAARDNMAARCGMSGCGAVIYPGADPSMFQDGLYEKGEHCHFAHLGTLNGTRNLVVFLKALRMLLDSGRIPADMVRVDVYGSLDSGSRKAIEDLGLARMVCDHGVLSRKEALRAMQRTDCLLLIQNTIFFSSETIPSKVYEYLQSGRPILGLVHHNQELREMLAQSGHFPVRADDLDEMAAAVEGIVASFAAGTLSSRPCSSPWTVERAVDQLIAIAEAGRGGQRQNASGGRTA
jgi:glycosyltransferase involved in cell wall biosynthesis